MCEYRIVILNKKTGLLKMIHPGEYNRANIGKIFEFYSTLKNFTISYKKVLL